MANFPISQSVEKKLYFYKFKCTCDGKTVPIIEVFDAYIQKTDNNNSDLINRGLAIQHFNKYHYLNLQNHQKDANVYQGLFFSLRSTDFPYLFNVINGNRKEITSSEDDTLMELTHFLCYVNFNLIVSEFNFYGARIEQLGRYLSSIMQDVYPSRTYHIEVLPIVIPEYYKKIANCKSISKIQFKVANPGLKLLKEQGIINAYDIASGNIANNEPFYVDVEISGYKRGSSIPVIDIKSFINKIISVIKKSEVRVDSEVGKDNPIFKIARIRGFDVEESRTIPYDLLDEKLLRVVKIDKLSAKSKYVDSKKMFQSIQEAFQEKHALAIQYMQETVNEK